MIRTMYCVSRHHGTPKLPSQAVVGSIGATCRKRPCSSKHRQLCSDNVARRVCASACVRDSLVTGSCRCSNAIKRQVGRDLLEPETATVTHLWAMRLCDVCQWTCVHLHVPCLGIKPAQHGSNVRCACMHLPMPHALSLCCVTTLPGDGRCLSCAYWSDSVCACLSVGCAPMRDIISSLTQNWLGQRTFLLLECTSLKNLLL